MTNRQELEAAMKLAREGKGAAAVDSIRKALSSAHGDSGRSMRRQLCLPGAIIAENSGLPAEAIEFYKVVLADDPQDTRALYGSAAIHESMGNFNEATQCYEECREACLSRGDRDVLEWLDHREKLRTREKSDGQERDS